MFGKNLYKEIFDKVEKNQRVCIYGVGDIGQAIKKELAKQRKDVKVAFFLDTVKTGEFEGLNIISPLKIQDYENKYDKIIIASNTNRNDMNLVLQSLKVPQDKIIKVPLEEILEKINQKKIDKSKKILKNPGDQKLYQILGELWLKFGDKKKNLIEIENNFSRFKEKIGDNVPLEQYFEYTNNDAVKVCIDGGSFNGLHALLFCNEFKNIEKVYAFEPNYNDFKMLNSYFDKKPSPYNITATLIENNPKIEMIEKGLWNSEEVLEFVDVPKNRAASRIFESKLPFLKGEVDVVKIEATYIDKFVKDRKIKKVDFIKLDVENSEIKVIEGAKNTILRDRPQMAISIYHSCEHFLNIPLILDEMLKDYVFRLGHYTRKTCETVLYAIPKELYKG